jgi:Alpha/beta hydrolase domain
MKAASRLALLAILVVPVSVGAEVKSLVIHQHEPFVEGMVFGDTGSYVRLAGVAHFAVDPNHQANRAIVDLNLAPLNADGKVEFEADVFILAPKDLTRGNRALFYEVNNRGNKLSLNMFNNAASSNNPATVADAGNGFLFRRGYVVVWCGWISELLPGNNRLLLRAPVATKNGQPIRGVVRYEMVTDTPAETLPLSRREGHGSYPPSAKGEISGVLTWRQREADERVVIPRGQWSLEKLPPIKVKEGVAGTLPQIRCRVAGGFRPGYIYELVCEAEGPIVQGLGFAATRDLISFLRYDSTPKNPLRLANNRPAIEQTFGFGVSQSGRFLRHFLYQNFNVDEKDRRVFDGLMPHVAGGGLGSFNHRFAQPTRHNGQHEEHLYPTDIFPFTYGTSTDPFSRYPDGILIRNEAKITPKIMHTQSAAEYWHRSGSLVHTDPSGKEDSAIPEAVRIYAFGGTQHGPAADPPGRGIGQNLLNPGDYRPQLRALFDALDAWVKSGTQPPPSLYPRIDQGTLVGWRQPATGFPSLPGVRYPEEIQQPSALYFGPDFAKKGIITFEPPQLQGGSVGPWRYGVKVPRSGPDGNDLGTLLPAEVAVPIATHTGWNLRRRDAGAEDALVSLSGSYIPFSKTKAEATKTGDPRPSLEERYGTFATYKNRLAERCAAMVKDRYLLAEDVERILKAAEKRQNSFTAK